jgi:hypothetical protein
MMAALLDGARSCNARAAVIRRAQVVGACLVLLVAGCTGGPNRPTTHAVKGTVTFEGKPLEGALVSFIPEGDHQPANGTTDASGVYTLTTFTQGDGAMEGRYKVTVTKFPAASGGAGGEGDDYVPPSGDLPTPKNELPKQYASPAESGFTATVTPGGGTFDFSLTK